MYMDIHMYIYKSRVSILRPGARAPCQMVFGGPKLNAKCKHLQLTAELYREPSNGKLVEHEAGKIRS